MPTKQNQVTAKTHGEDFHHEIVTIDGQSPLLIETHDEQYIDWYKQGGNTAIAISVSFGPMSAVSSVSDKMKPLLEIFALAYGNNLSKSGLVGLGLLVPCAQDGYEFQKPRARLGPSHIAQGAASTQVERCPCSSFQAFWVPLG